MAGRKTHKGATLQLEVVVVTWVGTCKAHMTAARSRKGGERGRVLGDG